MPEFASFCGTEQFQPETLLEHAVQAERAKEVLPALRRIASPA